MTVSQGIPGLAAIEERATQKGYANRVPFLSYVANT